MTMRTSDNTPRPDVFFQTDRGDLIMADVIQGLRSLPDESVHCCVTSPPYFGLRDYQTAKWEGGSADCDHALPSDAPNSTKMTDGQQTSHAGRFAHLPCKKCGAIRIDSQIGLEKTPEEYVAKMVDVFREVRRVLRKDGLLFLNLGDSYWGGKGQSGSRGPEYQDERSDNGESLNKGYQTLGGAKLTKPTDGKHDIFKPKDLCMIPARVAIALQSDGWYLRSEIIWHKPNPMPESVTDRPTKSHEMIYLLSKSSKYYYDYEAVKEPSVDKESYTGRRKRNAGQMDSVDGNNYKFHGSVKDGVLKSGQTYPKRNLRDVWTIATQSFKGSHFATFPKKLIEPCILAGCPENGTVLDPFGGAGTTAVVSESLGRNWVLIELNPEYCEMAKKRIEASIPKDNLFRELPN